jgi:ATP-dependent Lon protease
MPRRNDVDLEDVPDEIKEVIEFVFVDTVDDVLTAALEDKPPSKAKGKKKAASKPKKKKAAVKAKAKPRSKAKKKAPGKKKSEPQEPVGAPS